MVERGGVDASQISGVPGAEVKPKGNLQQEAIDQVKSQDFRDGWSAAQTAAVLAIGQIETGMVTRYRLLSRVKKMQDLPKISSRIVGLRLASKAVISLNDSEGDTSSVDPAFPSSTDNIEIYKGEIPVQHDVVDFANSLRGRIEGVILEEEQRLIGERRRTRTFADDELMFRSGTRESDLGVPTNSKIDTLRSVISLIDQSVQFQPSGEKSPKSTT